MRNLGRQAQRERKHPSSRSTRRARLSFVAGVLIAAVALTGYLASPPRSQALSSGVVISQVYGNDGTNFLFDYVELFNRGTTPVDITGWSVQVAKKANGGQSNQWDVTPLCPSGTCIIPPHSYFLVGEFGSSASSNPTPDAIGTTDILGNNGKIALVNNTTALTVACPLANASVIDFVGYGPPANCSEGNANAPNPANQNQAICRKGAGFVETDNNANDFESCTPDPHNSISPSDARLVSFKATGYEDGRVYLQWQTGYEVNNLGFKLYRDQGGKRTLVTPQIIAGSALMVGPSTALTAGQSYSVWDSASDAEDAQYWLEDLDLKGQSSWQGPITIERAPGKGKQPLGGPRRAVLLNDLGSGEPLQGSQPVETRAVLDRTASAQFEIQSSLSARPAVKMYVQREGWYRITQPELVAAGFDARTDARNIQLFADGQEQPLAVVGDGQFGESSAIEFYGVGLDSASTDKHAYWLVAGSKPGLRITSARGRGSKDSDASFLYTVERKDRTVYFSGLRNGDKENFFGAVIARTPVAQTLAVRNINRAAGKQAVLEVAAQGVTDVPHLVKVAFNGVDAGEITFDGQSQGLARITLPQSSLKDGDNQVELISMFGDSDISLVNYVRLSYWHSYAADNNALRLTASAKQRVTVDGFTSGAIRVMDITDPGNAQEVTGTVQQKGSFAVTFAAPGKKQRTLLAFASDQVRKPADVRADQFSNWRDAGHAADLVVITTRELAGSVDPLIALRQSQGYKVAIADVEDIYDEFSFGNKSPQAIKDFLAYARAKWQTAPRFVLIAGDASLDPKNYFGNGDFDLVPTRLIDTQLMETASDDWFADFNGDGVAEMAVGRLPIRSPQEAALMIAKITGYDGAAKPEGVFLISDGKDGYDFAGASARLRSMIPAGTSVEAVERDGMDATAAKSQVMSGLNRGPKLVNYVGHGSVDIWKGNLLTSDDARGLANGQSLPLYIMMTCLNGYFQDPQLDSLAESLMKAERGGAVAVWASSGMTRPDAQAAMNQRVFQMLFGPSSQTIGEATVKAKSAVSDPDVRRTWMLFGDPSMKLK
ncbi:MAG TPA: C25 family cysteine peptidase [Blastocatellia bacterium]|nr:C25 family cysteine peptidase [Blastocatellia bacterium]